MAAVLLVLGAVWAALYVLPGTFVGPAPDLTQAERTEALMNERRTLITLLAGVGAATGLYYTAKRHELDRDENRTDRYTKAVEQLGHDSIHIRLGGVYALERIVRDSPADGQVIAEVLSAFVREETTHSPRAGEAAATSVAGDREHVPAVRTDVAAALEVLSRYPLAGFRVTLHGANLTKANLMHANLSHADLRSTNLSHANLLGANLTQAGLGGANLTHAKLTHADLAHADLTNVDLTHGRLIGTNLTGANLVGANLTHAILLAANLHHAILRGADLTRANLGQADLRNANLTRAVLRDVNLTRANLAQADLRKAELTLLNRTDADLTEAILDDADLERATGNGEPGLS